MITAQASGRSPDLVGDYVAARQRILHAYIRAITDRQRIFEIILSESDREAVALRVAEAIDVPLDIARRVLQLPIGHFHPERQAAINWELDSLHALSD